MDIHNCFPSQYLKASDLQGQTVRVTIERIVMETLDGEDKPVVYFAGKKKGFVLNRVNSYTLADALGPETDGWIGKQIKLRPEKTQYQGKQVDCLRVHFDAPDAPEGNTAF